MPQALPVHSVYNAHSLRALVRGEYVTRGGNRVLGDLVMDVYTGWVNFENFWDPFDKDAGGDELVTFVPLGPIDHGMTDPGPQLVDIQAYNNLSLDGRPLARPIVHAAISSFGERPAVVAINSATIRVEPRVFPGALGEQFVLIMGLNVAIQDGRFHSVSYQVTVLAQPREQGEAVLAEMQAAAVSIDRHTQPF